MVNSDHTIPVVMSVALKDPVRNPRETLTLDAPRWKRWEEGRVEMRSSRLFGQKLKRRGDGDRDCGGSAAAWDWTAAAQRPGSHSRAAAAARQHASAEEQGKGPHSPKRARAKPDRG